jgi:hypothetical protein
MSSFKFNLTDYDAGRKYERLLLPYICESIGDVKMSPERSRYDYYNPHLWAELKTRTPRYGPEMNEWLFNSKKAFGYTADKKLYFFYYFIKDCSFWMMEYNPTKFAQYETWQMPDEDGQIQLNWLIPRTDWTRICTEIVGGIVSNPSDLLSSYTRNPQVAEISAS